MHTNTTGGPSDRVTRMPCQCEGGCSDEADGPSRLCRQCEISGCDPVGRRNG